MAHNPASPLVSTQWLADHLTAPKLSILDATFMLPKEPRNAHTEFQKEHIAGAQFFDIDVIADTNNPLPHMLPSADEFASAAGKLGIDNSTQVIVYDNNSFMASARVWWTFRVFGHDNVHVLNGGLACWRAESRPLKSSITQATQVNFQTQFNNQLVRNLSQMQLIVKDTSCQVIDARSPARFTGDEPEVRSGLRSGHIPGSLNIHYAQLIDKNTHTFRSIPEIETLFTQTDIKLNEPIVSTCGSGVTAAILALGLYRLGYANIPVYDGSWTEWGSRNDTAIETGV